MPIDKNIPDIIRNIVTILRNFWLKILLTNQALTNTVKNRNRFDILPSIVLLFDNVI